MDVLELRLKNSTEEEYVEWRSTSVTVLPLFLAWAVDPAEGEKQLSPGGSSVELDAAGVDEQTSADGRRPRGPGWCTPGSQ